MKRFFALVFLFCSIFFITNCVNAQTADFEDLSLNTESYWNGSDGTGGFYSGGFAFSNNYNADWSSWDGFAYSNITDTAAEGFDAQYNVITGSGADGSVIYAVAYVSSFAANPPTITLDTEQVLSGAFFTNNNYAFYSMRDGDDFAKKFTDEDNDWFMVTITGFDDDGVETGIKEFMLADGTSIVNTWKWVDLSGLGAVKQLIFELSSSDNGDWGMNTPAYFCMDNFNNEDDGDENDIHHSDGGCFINSVKSEFSIW